MRQKALASVLALVVGVVVVLELAPAQGQRPPATLDKGLVRIEIPKPPLPPLLPSPPKVEPPAAPKLVVPDLTQTDPEIGAPGGGESHCGPVAASNALFWLSQHGFERLLPEGDSDKQRHVRLVRALASRQFMGTSAHSGTSASGVLKGLDLYFRANRYRVQRLRYQGWRAHQLRYSARVRIPELEFLAQGLADGGIALINVGWYRPGKKEGVYRRHGGHWLTVVSVDDDALVVHDPAPWSGNEPRAHHVRAEALGEGWLIGEDGPFPSLGFRVLRGDLDVKRAGEVAIIDGAVVLVPERESALRSAP